MPRLSRRPFVLEVTTPPVPFAIREEGKFVIKEGKLPIQAIDIRGALAEIRTISAVMPIYKAQIYAGIEKDSVETGKLLARYLSPLAATLAHDGVTDIGADGTLLRDSERVSVRTEPIIELFTELSRN